MKQLLVYILRPTFYIFKFIPLSIVLSIIAGVAPICVGYNLSVVNTSFNIISGDLRWCGTPNEYILAQKSTIRVPVYCDKYNTYQFLVVSTFFLWAAAGSLLSKYFLAKYGRRKSLMYINVFFMISSLMGAFSNNLITLYAYRAVTGILSGLATVIPAIFMTEMAIAEHRNIVSFIPQIATTFGVLLGIIAGYPLRNPFSSISAEEFVYLIPDWEFNQLWWRIMIGLMAPVSGLSALLLIEPFSFETPVYLKATGRHYEAFRAEKIIRQPYNLLNQESTDISNDDSLPSVAPNKGEIELSDLNVPRYSLPEDSKLSSTSFMPIKIALKKHDTLRSKLLIGWVFAMLQQFTGIMAFYSSSNYLFEKVGLAQDDLTKASVIMAVLSLLCSIVSPFILKNLKRRKMLIFGSFGISLSLYAVVVVTSFQFDNANELALMSVFSAIILYGLTLGPGLFIYLNELLITEIKDAGLSIAYALNWTASFIVLAMTPLMEYDYFYVFFSSICFATTLIAFKFAPETYFEAR